eukprot:11967569-Alexandrium_andersonii.AAC.1
MDPRRARAWPWPRPIPPGRPRSTTTAPLPVGTARVPWARMPTPPSGRASGRTRTARRVALSLIHI